MQGKDLTMSTYSLLDATRRRFDAKRRLDAARGRLLRPPSWMTKDDALRALYPVQERLLREGEIVLGRMIVANAALLRPGPFDHGALLVLARDPALERAPDALAEIARDLAQLRDAEDQANPHAASFGKHLRAEHRRTRRAKIHPSLTEGWHAERTDVVVGRAHLPDGVLHDAPIPVLVLEELEPVMIVPSPAWADDLRRAWSDLTVT
jgi:hypothetical protein